MISKTDKKLHYNLTHRTNHFGSEMMRTQRNVFFRDFYAGSVSERKQILVCRMFVDKLSFV